MGWDFMEIKADGPNAPFSVPEAPLASSQGRNFSYSYEIQFKVPHAAYDAELIYGYKELPSLSSQLLASAASGSSSFVAI